mmetsp:Transcript_55035/g.116968  ORF Transcript_55035/g.116968 Transcript_55035/m.116968 type:complete len:230 (-) Transcript_55035:444-1133(-)
MLIVQGVDTGRHLPLQQVQRRAPPRRHVGDPRRVAAPLRGVGARAAPDDAQQSALPSPVPHGLGDRERAGGVGGYLEHAHGPAPYGGFTSGYASSVRFHGSGADVERHVPVGHVGGLRDQRIVGRVAARVAQMVDRKQDLHVASLGFDEKALREVVDVLRLPVLVPERLAGLVKRVPYMKTCRLEKSVCHRSANGQVVDLTKNVQEQIDLIRNLCPAHDGHHGAGRAAE